MSIYFPRHDLLLNKITVDFFMDSRVHYSTVCKTLLIANNTVAISEDLNLQKKKRNLNLV